MKKNVYIPAALAIILALLTPVNTTPALANLAFGIASFLMGATALYNTLTQKEYQQ